LEINRGRGGAGAHDQNNPQHSTFLSTTAATTSSTNLAAAPTAVPSADSSSSTASSPLSSPPVHADNLALLSERGRDALLRLIQYDADFGAQRHVYANWPDCGVDDEGKKRLADQVRK
jgi:hypothetical protein